MSSGKITKDSASFEVNLGYTSGHFLLTRIPAMGLTPERVLIRFQTHSGSVDTSASSASTIVIDKNYSRIFAHWFRSVAEVMDEWYPNEDAAKQNKIDKEK